MKALAIPRAAIVRNTRGSDARLSAMVATTALGVAERADEVSVTDARALAYVPGAVPCANMRNRPDGHRSSK